jgi:hypothetical protein
MVLSVESVTRQLFDELPICLKNGAIGPRKVYMLGMSLAVPHG